MSKVDLLLQEQQSAVPEDQVIQKDLVINVSRCIREHANERKKERGLRKAEEDRKHEI